MNGLRWERELGEISTWIIKICLKTKLQQVYVRQRSFISVSVWSHSPESSSHAGANRAGKTRVTTTTMKTMNYSDCDVMTRTVAVLVFSFCSDWSARSSTLTCVRSPAPDRSVSPLSSLCPSISEREEGEKERERNGEREGEDSRDENRVSQTPGIK